jgi:hypothetical protein
MPFTACHAAVAAPLARRGLVLSALVVGCMAPDFEFFVRLSVASRWGHTLPGMIWFSLPAGLVVLWLYHALLKRPLLALLPAALQQALAPEAARFRFGPPRRFALILASLLLGIASHVAMDAFTHETGPAVVRFAWLSTLVPMPFFPPQPAYHALQHGLSLIFGLALLAQVSARLRLRGLSAAEALAGVLRSPAPRALLPLVVSAVAFGLCYGCAVAPELLDFQLRSLRQFSAPAFAATCTALLLELIGFAWMTRLRPEPLDDLSG